MFVSQIPVDRRYMWDYTDVRYYIATKMMGLMQTDMSERDTRRSSQVLTRGRRHGSKKGAKHSPAIRLPLLSLVIPASYRSMIPLTYITLMMKINEYPDL
jgi:hypothetical protein